MPTRKQGGFAAILIVILLILLAAVIIGGIYYTKKEVKTETTDISNFRVTPETVDQYVNLVNQNLSSFRKVNIVVHGLSAEGADVVAYDEKGVMRKIIATFYGETGKVLRELYYHDGFLQVVFEKAEIYDQPFGKVEKTEENWFYFENAEMVKWLFGPNKIEKIKDDEFSAQEQDIVRTSAELLTALELESTQDNYTNAKWKFSLAIPEGFLVQGDDTLLHVTKKPTADNETPSPEMNIKIEQGSKTTVDNSAEMKVISQEAVSVNNIGGHKIVVSYKSYPEGNKCPIYRLHRGGIVYEFSLYECLDSDIFETVVKSFKIV